MPAASPLSIFMLILLRPAPVSLSRHQSAGHLNFSICSIYLASFFLLLAPHRRLCLPNKLACRFVDFSSLPYLSADKRAAATPCIRTDLVFKVLLATWVRPDRWHAKSERTTNLLPSSPLWGQGYLPKLWGKLPCCTPRADNTAVLLKAVFSPEDTEMPFSKLDNNKYKIGKIDKVNKID